MEPKLTHQEEADLIRQGWAVLADMEMFPVPTSNTPPSDMVVLPKHYSRYKIEPVHFIGENNLNFFQGNIVKYVVRHDAKNGLEDLLKVIRYGIMYYRYTAGDPKWNEEDPFTLQIKQRYGGPHGATPG